MPEILTGTLAAIAVGLAVLRFKEQQKINAAIQSLEKLRSSDSGLKQGLEKLERVLLDLEARQIPQHEASDWVLMKITSHGYDEPQGIVIKRHQDESKVLAALPVLSEDSDQGVMYTVRKAKKGFMKV